VLLHKVLVQIGAAIYHLLVLAAAILDFLANGSLGGDLNLFAMVFENLVSIPITIQNFKNWSQSARFSQIASTPRYNVNPESRN